MLAAQPTSASPKLPGWRVRSSNRCPIGDTSFVLSIPHTVRSGKQEFAS
jgi:hypothetical protein